MLDLTGKKTYIVAALAAVATLFKYLGYLDDDTFNMLVGLFGAGGMATMAAKSNRIDKKLIIILSLLLFPTLASAQTTTASLEYSYLNVTVTEVQTYQQVITIDSTVLTAVPTCVQSGVNTVCTVVAPQLATGSHTVSVAATKNSITAELKVTGLGGTGGPVQPGNPKVKVTVTVIIS